MAQSFPFKAPFSMTQDKAPTRSAREPQALSSEYHKARKQLILWAGILLVWELVGVDLAKAEASGGNVGAIVSAIKSPQAVPWVLIVLVAYFFFKMNIEWHQCSLPRRQLRVSKIDFYSAWVVTLGAYLLYVAQRISRVQFADLLVSEDRFSVIFALVLVVSIALYVRVLSELFHKPFRLGSSILRIVRPTVTMIGAVIITYISSPRGARYSLIGAIIGLAAGLILRLGYRFLPEEKRPTGGVAASGH